MIEAGDWGEKARLWLDQIAAATETGPGVTRLPFTPEHRAAIAIIAEWMTGAGLSVHMDAAGTLIGRLAGPPGAPVMLMGSHQDSVRHGGGFDGIMGVALPILALERLQQKGVRLPYGVEVLAFADEEGVRFPTALMGPRALAGSFDMTDLQLADAEGVALGTAMQDFGLNPAELPRLRRNPAHLLGYLECHIEQGPVLDSEHLPLGVVTAICGIERHVVTLTGEAAHAGTTPMKLRHDALAGAAELISEVERMGRETPGLLATVGSLSVHPGVVNTVPGQVKMSVELRAPDDSTREAAGAVITRFAEDLCRRRGLGLSMSRLYAQGATPCDLHLSDLLAEAVSETVGRTLRLPSGATHDASAMADLCPIAMLFIACSEGISHHPNELAFAADMGQAIETLARFLCRLSA